MESMKFYIPLLPILVDYYISDQRSRYAYNSPAFNRNKDVMTARWKEFVREENWLDEPGTELEEAAYELTQTWKLYLADINGGFTHAKKWEVVKRLVMTKYENIERPDATDLTDYMEEFNERLV
jgi:hypothetical protein